MRRGKRFLENDNMFIYVGTAIFILLAVALGIIMYMSTRTGVRIQNGGEDIATQQETENAASEIGKTVEEQENSTQTDTPNEESLAEETTETNAEPSKEIQTPERTETPDETNTSSTTNAPVEETPTETKREVTFVKPTEGEIICEYAKDNLIYSETLKEWVTHTAIDIKADKTSVIKSAADGVIKSIVNDPRYGLTVVISHDEGYETVYSNLLTAEFVVEGEEVKQGQTIGTAGNTASFESSMPCHLHFELLKDGEYLDPTIYLK